MHDTPRRYIRPLDEQALFAHGATGWRMDAHTYHTLHQCVDRASWHTPTHLPKVVDPYTPQAPLGQLAEGDEAQARGALQAMLNDPSLCPHLRMLGLLEVGGIELQNGALDHNWHHDGLAGKRHGHAGDFFSITYLSEPRWDDAWGGHFEYASRTLGPNWPMEGFVPTGPIHRIAPQARSTLLGWNQNPMLIHRSAPLTQPRNRITLIASIALIAR